MMGKTTDLRSSLQKLRWSSKRGFKRPNFWSPQDRKMHVEDRFKEHEESLRFALRGLPDDVCSEVNEYLNIAFQYQLLEEHTLGADQSLNELDSWLGDKIKDRELDLELGREYGQSNSIEEFKSYRWALEQIRKKTKHRRDYHGILPSVTELAKNLAALKGKGIESNDRTGLILLSSGFLSIRCQFWEKGKTKKCYRPHVSSEGIEIREMSESEWPANPRFQMNACKYLKQTIFDVSPPLYCSYRKGRHFCSKAGRKVDRILRPT